MWSWRGGHRFIRVQRRQKLVGVAGVDVVGHTTGVHERGQSALQELTASLHQLLAAGREAEPAPVASGRVGMRVEQTGPGQRTDHPADRRLCHTQALGEGALGRRAQQADHEQHQEPPVGQSLLGAQDAVGRPVQARGQRMQGKTELAFHGCILTC